MYLICTQENGVQFLAEAQIIGLWCNGNILLLHGRDEKYNPGSSPGRPTKKMAP